MGIVSFVKELLFRPSIRELKLKLESLERDKKQAKGKYEKLKTRQKNLVSQIVSARKDGDNLSVNFLWDEIKSTKQEAALLSRTSKRFNLEGLTLRRFITGLELLDSSKNPTSVKTFIKRMGTLTTSKLLENDIKEKDYLDELNFILESVGLESENFEFDDPEKDKFLEEIDFLITMEDAEGVDEKQEELAKKIIDNELTT